MKFTEITSLYNGNMKIGLGNYGMRKVSIEMSVIGSRKWAMAQLVF